VIFTFFGRPRARTPEGSAKLAHKGSWYNYSCAHVLPIEVLSFFYLIYTKFCEIIIVRLVSFRPIKLSILLGAPKYAFLSGCCCDF